MWKKITEMIHTVSIDQGKWQNRANGGKNITWDKCCINSFRENKMRLVMYLCQALEDLRLVKPASKIEESKIDIDFLLKAFSTFGEVDFEYHPKALEWYEIDIKGTAPDRLAWVILEVLDMAVAFDIMDEEIEVVDKHNVLLPSFKDQPMRCVYSIIEEFVVEKDNTKAFSVLISSVIKIGKEIDVDVVNYLNLAFAYHKTRYTREGKF